MFKKLYEMFGGALLAKFLGPSQMASLARTALKAMGGFLLGLGFSQGAVDSWAQANEPVVAGLISLAVGALFSFFTHTADKKEEEKK